ncbi:IS1/IS1595 family N-terminal zinc-binding domain-containing protein [Microcoleus sp. Pol7_A1]|uniref:IS1/IS1595 family N-terminal zinc-binding domain-containing protein n=1 Tax=Microcoleus sp. Pol7_A1 TaxID=2818893 RepID=UPI004040831E
MLILNSINCPPCGFSNIVKNGHTHSGKQNFKFIDGRRQFVQNPRYQTISEETTELIDRLLLEKIS